MSNSSNLITNVENHNVQSQIHSEALLKFMKSSKY